jgi:AdoMet-dependent heme synthase
MSSPVYVDWAIERKCNLNCRHCVGMEEGELTRAEALRITGDIISLAPRWVILEGGEPLLRRDLFEIGRMFHQANIDVYVITNGNAFTEKRLKELATFSPKVLFSFDGADATTYEYVKTGAKFETAIKWAKRCGELGIFHGITTVLTRTTMGQVKDFIQLTKNLGGKYIIFLPLKPFGENPAENKYYRENALTPEEQEVVIQEIYHNSAGLDIFYDEPFLWNLATKHGFSLSGSDSGITIPEVEGCAAFCSMYIQNDGTVRPCMFAPARLTFGNAAREPLPLIWDKMQKSTELTGWADKKCRKGTCAVCRSFDSCRGCLARTTILKGDPLESDPSCPMRLERH